MDVEHVIVAQWTGVVEILSRITPGPPGTILQGALDVIDPGARRNEEENITNSGVKMPRRLRNGIYPRRMMIVVRTFYSYINMELYKCKSNFSDL